MPTKMSESTALEILDIIFSDNLLHSLYMLILKSTLYLSFKFVFNLNCNKAFDVCMVVLF